MEYLTLQDLPHRQFHPLHSRSMASDEQHYHHRGSDKGGLPSLAANHHMRHSPPFQPGEQRPAQNALPSFSQLLQNVREPSPPRTPSRRNESMESSPGAPPPQFEDVAWSDGKRRRVDTVADIHHRPSNASEYPAYNSRRASSVVVDPALSSAYSPPRGLHTASMHPSVSSHYHRPSLPYPPPPTNPAAHARHQSSPVPQGQAGYHHPSYSHASSHNGMQYDPRSSYYQDPHQPPHGHSYDRPPQSEPYYPRAAYAGAPHPAYENTYHQQAQPYNYTFQSTLGVDNNSFNRKRRGNLPKEATGILKAWFSAHRDSPYPTEDEKVTLCNQTQLTLNQVSNWFINARRRAPQKEQRDARETANEDA